MLAHFKKLKIEHGTLISYRVRNYLQTKAAGLGQQVSFNHVCLTLHRSWHPCRFIAYNNTVAFLVSY